MQITKRDGRTESVKFDKVLARLKKQTYELSRLVDPSKVAQKVIAGIYDGITTKELDMLAAETSASLSVEHPDYSILAARIAISSFHKQNKRDFSDVVEDLYRYVNKKTSKPSPLVSDEFYATVMANKAVLNDAIDFDRDFNHDYFGWKTLERSYLLQIDGKPIECPQHMFMRVAVGIWNSNIDEVLKTYEIMSTGKGTHATPTLFQSGTPMPQMSSCFLMTMQDSLDSIYKIISDSAKISKAAGGIGIDVSEIRSDAAYIAGTNGRSNGIVPMLQVLNATARYVDQGGGKRKGSIAVYSQVWHSQVFDLLDIRKNSGKEELRARDLFPALWIDDLFMKQVDADGDWALFSPDEAPGLTTAYGQEFEDLYNQYKAEGRARKIIKARDLWAKIVESLIETGTPYMMSKDAANKKSNQSNLGFIRQSNLCTEIVEFTSQDEHAVCNLFSIALPKFVKNKTVDYHGIMMLARQAVKNLNEVIDRNYYPTPETRRSNLRHRPMGLGVQGLADVYAMLGLAFESAEAADVNRKIFESIYFGAVNESIEQARLKGTYETYQGSPASKGKLQFHLWGASESDLSGLWDWKTTMANLAQHGLRNSLLVAPMPTASTSQILGNTEAIEPFTSNVFLRKTLSGEFPVVNKHLVRDLEALGLWTESVRNQIITKDGSVLGIVEIPIEIQERYKTVWEIRKRAMIDQSADRGLFVCQSQSMNLYFDSVNAAQITSALFHGWRRGLKTLSYYIRTKIASSANKNLGIDFNRQEAKPAMSAEQIAEDMACSLDNPDACISCGS